MTKFTREDYEMAAKAAGYPIRFSSDGACFRDGPDWMGQWEPADDDGDAFRLAVVLGMDLGIYLTTSREPARSYANTKSLLGYGANGYASYQDSAYSKEEHGDDPYAATRRAIFRAAIAIGRAMP